MSMYYTNGHKIMADSGDGPQDIIAMCYDEATAEEIVKALNMRDTLQGTLDEDNDISSEFIEKLLEDSK